MELNVYLATPCVNSYAAVFLIKTNGFDWRNFGNDIRWN